MRVSLHVVKATLPGLCVAVLSSCATPQARKAEPPKDVVIKAEPIKVVGKTETPDALQFYDAEMLFNRGMEFLDERYYADARQYFQKLLDEFPDSSYAHSARFNLGVALLETGDAAGALARFEAYIAESDDEKDKLHAEYKRGACLSMLGRYQETVEIFDAILDRDDLDREDQIEAAVDSGIGYFMLKDRLTAEYRFQQAVKWHNEDKEARFDKDYHYAQALFYLGEIARLDYSDYKLTLPEGKNVEDKMADQLEQKCDKLLRAQYNFIKVIRTGHAGWASAAGYKVGTLYEDLHDEMLKLPVPPEFDAEQADIYRREVRKKVAILVRKAIKIYESTVQMAKRTGADNIWVGRTEKSLQRMQELLREVDDIEREDKASS